MNGKQHLHRKQTVAVALALALAVALAWVTEVIVGIFPYVCRWFKASN